jgi:hypothetical protein
MSLGPMRGRGVEGGRQLFTTASMQREVDLSLGPLQGEGAQIPVGLCNKYVEVPRLHVHTRGHWTGVCCDKVAEVPGICVCTPTKPWIPPLSATYTRPYLVANACHVDDYFKPYISPPSPCKFPPTLLPIRARLVRVMRDPACPVAAPSSQMAHQMPVAPLDRHSTTTACNKQ